MNHPPSPNSSEQNPRAFAQGTGFVLQIVGFILLFGGCCLGSFSGLIQRPQDTLPASAAEWFRQSPSGALLAGLNVVISGVAGLALAVFGLGLQQERRRSGIGAMITTGLLMIGWWATTVAVALLSPSFVRIAIHLLLAIGATVLFMMAIGAERVLRLHPPPPDEPVTEEFLAQLARKKHRVEEDEP